MSVFKREKTLTEKQDEDDSLDTDVSIARKMALLRQLRNRGADPKTFKSEKNYDFKRIFQWLKTH